jgi:hypothetical protein
MTLTRDSVVDRLAAQLALRRLATRRRVAGRERLAAQAFGRTHARRGAISHLRLMSNPAG